MACCRREMKMRVSTNDISANERDNISFNNNVVVLNVKISQYFSILIARTVLIFSFVTLLKQ